jgi:hypothetical protein
LWRQLRSNTNLDRLLQDRVSISVVHLNLELLKSACLGSVSKKSNDERAFEDCGDLWRPDGVHTASEDIQQSIGRARRSIGKKRELESHGSCDRSLAVSRAPSARQCSA